MKMDMDEFSASYIVADVAADGWVVSTRYNGESLEPRCQQHHDDTVLITPRDKEIQIFFAGKGREDMACRFPIADFDSGFINGLEELRYEE